MNEREREIGARLKSFREGIKYSQASFADIIGLTRDQLAGVEYGRTPLKYAIACKIRFAFGLSLDWLCGGDMSPDDLSEDGKLPHPDSARIGRRALLTEVVEELEHRSGNEPRLAVKRQRRVDPAELNHRWFMVLALRNQLEDWFARVPDGYTRDFGDQLGRFAADYLKSIPPDPPELIQARLDGLLWEKMRAEAARKIFNWPVWPGDDKNRRAANNKAKTLTMEKTPVPALPHLIKRLNQATQARGSKIQLAAWLGVHRQMVTDWLSGKQKPGGEITLQLLQWVERKQQ
ncbi:MAG: helix-turn-helix transcriptional regulator [Verrucomicrobiota bacterium]|jgi:transcriptional regulator with XRE-family HTH domain